MGLKTKLVLAITALVFLIAGVVSLVYVHQLVKAAVLETYDTNRMVAEQVRFALRNALEAGSRTAPSTPTIRENCARWWPRRCTAIRRCRPRSTR